MLFFHIRISAAPTIPAVVRPRPSWSLKIMCVCFDLLGKQQQTANLQNPFPQMKFLFDRILKIAKMKEREEGRYLVRIS